MPALRLQSQQRIKKSADFDRVFKLRRSVSDTQVILYGLATRLPYARLGLSVSRRVGGAVVRNRWKRLIREAFRLTQGSLPEGIDLVIIPRQGVEPQLPALVRSLPRLAANVQKKLRGST